MVQRRQSVNHYKVRALVYPDLTFLTFFRSNLELLPHDAAKAARTTSSERFLSGLSNAPSPATFDWVLPSSEQFGAPRVILRFILRFILLWLHLDQFWTNRCTSCYFSTLRETTDPVGGLVWSRSVQRKTYHIPSPPLGWLASQGSSCGSSCVGHISTNSVPIVALLAAFRPSEKRWIQWDDWFCLVQNNGRLTKFHPHCVQNFMHVSAFLLTNTPTPSDGQRYRCRHRPC